MRRPNLPASTPSALAAFVLALAIPGGPLPAQSPAPVPGDIPFEAYHLENGLHVILSPDESATAVAVNLWYDVGSRNERPGRSGFAHLFEHLMFQGSESLEAGDHGQFVERAGGSLNASITEDRTNYFQTMPPERMNLALWLEADRMRALRITEESMRREIEVVKEERRLRYDNAPYGTTQLQAFYYAPYDSSSCFAYAHSPIGSMEDLDAAQLEDVQEFFDLYYTPNNATLAVVGAFDPAVARELIETYFGPIPRGADPPTVECVDPFAALPVDLTIPDSNAVLPAVFLSYGTVASDHPDAAALEVLGWILGSGQSSRLYQRMVREEQAAVQANAFSNTRGGPGLFLLLAIANQGVQGADLLTLLDEEIERVRSEGVTLEEVERARNQVRAQVILGRQGVMGRAEALQSANHFYGTPDAVRTWVEDIEAVSPEDVRAAARTYLTPERRAVLRTQPGSDAQEDR